MCKEHERVKKIAAMQQMINEGLASGISDRSTEDIRKQALLRLQSAQRCQL